MKPNPYQKGREFPLTDDERQGAEAIFLGSEFWSSERGCKIWSKTTTIRGYGRISIRSTDRGQDRVYFLAHRLAWEIAHKVELRPDQFVCHKCDTPRCCNVDHMFIGSAGDNWDDMFEKRRNPRGERHFNAKLNNESAAEIKWYLANTKLSQRKIGLLYGVAEGTVGHIKQRKNWLHVNPKEPKAVRTGQDSERKGT